MLFWCPYRRMNPLCIFMHQMEFMTISFSWKPLVPSSMELIQCLYLTQKHGWFYIWVIIYRYPHVLSDKSHRDSAKAGGITPDVWLHLNLCLILCWSGMSASLNIHETLEVIALHLYSYFPTLGSLSEHVASYIIYFILEKEICILRPIYN